MPFRPVGLRQQIVDEVDAAGSQERQRLVEMCELSRPRVRVDEIELTRWRVVDELAAVHHVKRHPRIAPKMPPGHGHDVRIRIDRLETRVGVHPREKPRGAKPRSRPELEDPGPRLRRRERGEERAGLGLGRHRESQGRGVFEDRLERVRYATNLVVVHRGSSVMRELVV